MVVVVVAAVVVVEEEVAAAAVNQDSVVINPVHELSVVPRRLKELGRGKHRSELHQVLLSVVELWSILAGLSQQLIVSLGNLPRLFVSGES